MAVTVRTMKVATLVEARDPIWDISPAWVRVLVRLGPPLGPIVVTSDGTLVRGADEVQAAIELGLDEIDARVISVKGQGELIEAALRESRSRPLSVAERRTGAELLLRTAPHLSDRYIADVAGVHHKSVATWRGAGGEIASCARRLGRDGKYYPPSHPVSVAESTPVTPKPGAHQDRPGLLRRLVRAARRLLAVLRGRSSRSSQETR